MTRPRTIAGALPFLAVACMHTETPRPRPPNPSAPLAPAPSAAVAPATTAAAPLSPPAPRPLSLACKDSGPSERMPLGGKPGRDRQITAFLAAQATDASPYEVDGRDRIYQRVSRELTGFVPFDPSDRLHAWKVILDPPVKDRERMAFFAPDQGPKTVPIVDLAQRAPKALLTWAQHPPPSYRVEHAEFGGGIRLEGSRGAFLVLGDDEYSSVDAAAELESGEVVIAKRSPSRIVLCTASRKACTVRVERANVASNSVGIARAPDGELALLDLSDNGAAPKLHRPSEAAPVALPPLTNLVASSDARCAAAGEWTVIGRAAVLEQGGVTWPSWLLMHLVGTIWCVDALEHWRGPVNRTVARFGAEPLAARYDLSDDAKAIVRTPGTCVIGR